MRNAEFQDASCGFLHQGIAMRKARCKGCGRLIDWSAERGTRLANISCPCGGQLERVIRREDAYVAARQLQRRPRAPRVRCAVCGKWRAADGHFYRRLEVASRLAGRTGLAYPGVDLLPAGAIVCWAHVTVPTAVAGAIHDAHAN